MSGETGSTLWQWKSGIFLWLFILLLSVSVSSLLAASKTPSARDGMKHSAIFNGKQNMPVKHYGIARKWEQRCYKGKTADCLTLARAFETGAGDLKADSRIAIGYYRLACEKGSGSGCATVAMMARGGLAGFTNVKFATDNAARGCEQLNSQASCAWLGMAYYTGDARPQDKSRAVQLWRTACQAKGTEAKDDGCRFLADHLWNTGDLVQQKEAFQIYLDRCEPGNRAWACLESARILESGRIIKKDVTTAATLLEHACLKADGNRTEACAKYGAQKILSGIAKDVIMGEDMLDAACRAEIAESCYAIGKLGLNQSNRHAKTSKGEGGYYVRRACDLGYATGCYLLGKAYQDGRMRKVRSAIGAILIDKACRLGAAEACQSLKSSGGKAIANIALKRWIDPSLPVAQQLQLAIRAADNGQGKRAGQTVGLLMEEQHEDAEWLLGNWFLNGKPGVVSTNRQNATILIENAARVGHVEAAKWMGMAHWYGDGVPLDRVKGKNYMAIAAMREDEAAIAIYRSMAAEPERQRQARISREQAEAAKRQKADWFGNWLRSRQNYTPSGSTRPSASALAARASWRRSQSRLDQMNFNNRIRYITGATSACPRSNPYC